VEIEREFGFEPHKKPFRSGFVGGWLRDEDVGLKIGEKIIFIPSGRQRAVEIIGFLVPEEGETVSHEIIKRWCRENGWRLASGFELASLRERWLEEFYRKLNEGYYEGYDEKFWLLTFAVALGNTYKGNYIFTTRSNWDWALSVFPPAEIFKKEQNFKFAIVKDSA